MRASGLGGFALLALAVSACGSAPEQGMASKPYPCWTTQIDGVAPSEQSMQWTWDGTTYSCPDPRCDRLAIGMDVPDSVGSGADPPPTSLSRDWTIDGNGGTVFELRVVLPDMRKLGPGQYPVSVDPYMDNYQDACFLTRSCSQKCGLCTLPANPVTLTIKEAVGGARAFPDLVTPDYKRTFCIDVAVDKPGKSGCGTCQDTLVATAHACYTSTAADFHATHGECSAD